MQKMALVNSTTDTLKN